MQDPLEKDRQRGQRAQLGEVVPRHDPVDHPDPLAHRGLHVLLGRALEGGAERRVREELRGARALEERQVAVGEVRGPPAQEHGVQGEDDRRIAGRLGAPDQALGDRLVLGPVELEPARRVAVRLGDLLERMRGGRAGHDTAARPRRPRRRRRARPRGGRSPARRSARAGRARASPSQHGRAEVALGDVAQHARDDAPAANASRFARIVAPVPAPPQT